MKYIRYIFLILIAIVLLTLSVANRQFVTLHLLPGDLSAVFGISGSISVPLFLVVFGGILAGLVIGFVWEYMREYKFRRDVSKGRKEVRKLEREVAALKEKTGEGKDDVLALIE